MLGELHFPHSLGLLYSAFTYFTGFRVNSGEYKLMGLAPYGEPKYVDVILRELIDLKVDGSFRLNMQYFNYGVGLTMTNARFNKLFGRGPRQPESKLTQSDMDLARSVQDVTEEVMFRMRNMCGRKPASEFARGRGAQCVANGKFSARAFLTTFGFSRPPVGGHLVRCSRHQVLKRPADGVMIHSVALSWARFSRGETSYLTENNIRHRVGEMSCREKIADHQGGKG
jgi:carbamoyltransferase